MKNTITATATATGFHNLGIAPGILEILKKLNFTVPTPIQEQAIPIAIEGKDLMGIAQTGTGKTLAFGIPVVQRSLNGGHALIVAPTRELADQIDETISKLGSFLNVRTAKLIGGESIGRQLRQLARNPQVIIGTPGRIIDHLQQRTLSLKKVDILVLDEADRMLDMGFAPQLRIILEATPTKRQTMLFSATMPSQIVAMANACLKLPIRVEIAKSGSVSEKVTQELFFVNQEDKPRLLEKILQDHRGSVLIFSRMKFSAKKITTLVRALGHTAAEIHSNRSLGQRREALEGFKTGRYRALVATDIAARGIDVSNIELVINYDLPENPEDYVHRIGRTARAGMSGKAISFARPTQRGDVFSIERLIRSALPVSKLPVLPASHAVHASLARPERPETFGRGGRGGARGFSSRGGHFPRRRFGKR